MTLVDYFQIKLLSLFSLTLEKKENYNLKI
jgi:hypothetical protein